MHYYTLQSGNQILSKNQSDLELIKSRNSKNSSLTKSLIHQQYLSNNSLNFITQVIAEITVL